MKLYDLIKGIAETDLENIEVDMISSDSRDEIKGDALFVCLKGANFDAHKFIPELSERGVKIFVTEYDCNIENQIVVSDTRMALSLLWANFFGNPQNELKFIGVTGTNGKTTVTTVMKNMLSLMGKKCGLIGTCQNEIGDTVIPAERTTPEPNEFYSLLRRMADEKCEWVIMEVSSQGLAQKRLGNIRFELAVFTNLTQDHLDFHKTIENYYEAKKMLFSMCENALINIDDEYGKRLYQEIVCKKFSFSLENEADFIADGIRLSSGGSTYWYSDSDKTFKVSVMLPGKYNVSNTVSVLAGLEILGFSPNDLTKLISEVHGVKGRCEVVKTDRDFTVIIDYAHTPDAIKNILLNVKECAEGRVVCLFGCGGNRDAKKRPLMARSAEKYADFLIITSDNPRNEEPMDIIKDILKGVEKNSYIVFEDRIEAIKYAVKSAKPKDIIVLAGKGHEDYQVLKNDQKIHLDEREIVKEALSELR